MVSWLVLLKNFLNGPHLRMTIPGDNAYVAIVKLCHPLFSFSGFFSWLCLFGRNLQACAVSSPCHQIIQGSFEPFPSFHSLFGWIIGGCLCVLWKSPSSISFPNSHFYGILTWHYHSVVFSLRIPAPRVETRHSFMFSFRGKQNWQINCQG